MQKTADFREKIMARPRGRPSFVPRIEDRELIQNLVTAGYTITSIAQLFKKNERWVRRWFKEEIHTGRAAIDGLVMHAFVKLVRAGDTRAILFYMERKLGFVNNAYVPPEDDKRAATIESWWDNHGLPPQRGLPKPDDGEKIEVPQHEPEIVDAMYEEVGEDDF